MDAREIEVAPAEWRERIAGLAATGARMLDFLTAVDDPGAGEIELVVHVVDVAGRRRHLVRARIPRADPRIESLIGVHPGAAWHEREVHEMFGVLFDGNPDLRPLLTDGSVDRPLRRTTPLPRRVSVPWPGAVDPADRPAAPPGTGVGKVAARPRSRLQPPGIPAEWTDQASPRSTP